MENTQMKKLIVLVTFLVSITLTLPQTAYALTELQQRVLVAWIRQAPDAEVVAFVESTNAAKLATLKAYALQRKTELEAAKTTSNALIQEGQARIAEEISAYTTAAQ